MTILPQSSRPLVTPGVGLINRLGFRFYSVVPRRASGQVRIKRVGLFERSAFRNAPTDKTRRWSKHQAVRQGAQLSEARSNRLIVSTRANWSTLHGGKRRRFNVGFGDAQDTRGRGAFFWLLFLCV